MEVTINGEHRQLVGNPPAVGEDVPHFKVFDKDNQKIKTRELFGSDSKQPQNPVDESAVDIKHVFPDQTDDNGRD